MKKYIDYRLALSAGLLSLNSLSSCTNTGQAYMEQPGESGSAPSCILTKEKDNASIATDAGKGVENAFRLTQEILDHIIENNFSKETIDQHCFVDKDLDLEAKDENGWTIFMHVANEESAKEIDSLAKKSFPSARKTFEYLLPKVNVNAQNNNLDTTLMIVARRMNNWVITHLLEKGANPFLVNKQGDNVMTLLIKSNYLNYAVSDLKIMINIIFGNIEAYIQKHGMPSKEVWNDFINSMPKAISEVHQENTEWDSNKEEDTKTAYQEALNDFLKRVDKGIA